MFKTKSTSGWHYFSSQTKQEATANQFHLYLEQRCRDIWWLFYLFTETLRAPEFNKLAHTSRTTRVCESLCSRFPLFQQGTTKRTTGRYRTFLQELFFLLHLVLSEFIPLPTDMVVADRDMVPPFAFYFFFSLQSDELKKLQQFSTCLPPIR
jgi:hypothetical protein